MKYGKMLILTMVGILLFAGGATAAELTVTIQGSGDGIVYGEGIYCGGGGEDCTETYPDETILHLEAYPDDWSEFKGWLVDDNPQKGALVIRKDITVTAIFEKIPIPDFETVSTRPSEFAYFTDLGPLYDTKREIVGALQGISTDEGFKTRVIIPGKATLTIPAITSIVVPTQGDRMVAHGEIFRDPVIEQSEINLYLYSFDGTLIRFVETRINSPFRVAAVGHTGDLWVAGSRGYTSLDPFVIRRYDSDGELLWEQMLPENTSPKQLVLSPDNRYAVLVLQNFALENTTIRLYEGNGNIVYEREFPPFFYEITFVSDQTVLFYSSDRWKLYRLDNPEKPFASGEFMGNLIGPYSIMPFPAKDCFLIKTAVVDKTSVRGYHLLAVHRETGETLAERLFDTDSEEGLMFYRVTEQNSFEVLISRDTIMELRIPK